MSRSWSLKIAEIAGIGVYVHATFLILIAWVAFNSWAAARTLPAVLGGVAFILAIFACVVLHELGHALAARRYGVRTRDIILLPIGGVARLERMPREPVQELVVALAGPAVNVLIAAALWAWLVLTGTLASAAGVGLLGGAFLARLLAVNVVLVIFNLLPAFPMDGGRVLRALLATRLEYGRATQIAAMVGRGMAILFGIAGFFFNPFLLFIALFVWTGASQEEALARSRPAPWGPHGGEVTIHPETIVTRPIEPGRVVGIQLADAMRLLQTGGSLGKRTARRLPVIHQGRVVGFLTLDDFGTPLGIERV